MRLFTKVAGPALWHSKRVRSLGDDAFKLHVFAITNPHQTACGVFPLPDGYAIADLQWDLQRYFAARNELVTSSLILLDEITSEILVDKWFRHNPPMNPSHRKAIVAAIEAIASDKLRAAAWQGLTDAESAATAKQEAKAQAAASGGNHLLNTRHLKRVT